MKIKLVQPTSSPQIQEPIKSKSPQTPTYKKQSGRRLWLAGLCAIPALAGVAGIVYYLQSLNVAIGSVSVLLLMGGAFGVWQGLKKKDEGIVLVGAVRTEKANSLNIYADRVAFEDESNPVGMPWTNFHDNALYYVHFKDGDKLEPFKLPDDDENERYYDPKEYANVITMPLNKKYFSWAPDLFKKIAIGAMLIIIIVEVIGLVALAG